ncbi:AraC family transcriptional regulator [Methylocapsa palsarum]|uniref:AraC-type DNA-binding protein n=1 Tax=Methylocapsa palsarum TaxID=1612308 RepID=A0A1I4A3C3_9HYPH|nr:AraC family transcriptional regulator [Methylocapsa palsarum]SFK50366.1 AraC-type DNA-binding protein [Methylocapsa palsarum]
MGPVAEMVERSGGSIARVFRRAELPLRLIDEPDRLILLKDQLNLVECAAREIGDGALAARLSTEAGFASLGRLGQRTKSMPRLDRAIACVSETIGSLLQSSTQFTLTVSAGKARWTYSVTDNIEEGRQKNEMLAFGYMLDLIRYFAGPGWTPSRLALPGPPPAGRTAIEDVFRCDLSRGETAAIFFSADLLDAPNASAADPLAAVEGALPDPEDFVACAEHLIGLDLLDGRPTIEHLCRRMEMPRRTLQRRLASRGVSFDVLLQRVASARAAAMLDSGASATDVAFELGYSDPAHFSRAFRSWTGQAPREWREGARR